MGFAGFKPVASKTGLAGMAVVVTACLIPASAMAGGKVLAFLNQISGVKTVGGVHNDQKTGGVAYYTDRVQAATGKVPGLWGGDFSYDGRIDNRWAMIYEAEKQWNAGALVNIMWHACPPTVPEPCTWEGDIHSRLSDAQWTDLVTDGGALNRAWKARMDRISPYLKYLDDRGIEVLWRPHHEMNQGNFWWGGRSGKDGTARLYRVTHDYLSKVKGLGNLVWTWDIQDLRFDWEGYHPGDAYFDVMALDMYSMGFTDSLYRTMLRLAGDKPIALGEVEKMPSPEVLARQPRYTFVMGWAYMTFDSNTGAQLTGLFTAPNVITRDEMPGWDKVTVGVASGGRLGPAAEGIGFTQGPEALSIAFSGSREHSSLARPGQAAFRLASLEGRLLRSVGVSGGRAEISTAGMRPGIYLASVVLPGRTLSRKVVLQGGAER